MRVLSEGYIGARYLYMVVSVDSVHSPKGGLSGQSADLLPGKQKHPLLMLQVDSPGHSPTACHSDSLSLSQLYLQLLILTLVVSVHQDNRDYHDYHQDPNDHTCDDHQQAVKCGFAGGKLYWEEDGACNYTYYTHGGSRNTLKTKTSTT